MKNINRLIALVSTLSLFSGAWAGTSEEDPVVRGLRELYANADLHRSDEQVAALLGNWECKTKSALRGNFSETDYLPLYEFSMWGNFLTHRADVEAEARTYTESNWGYIGALGHPEDMQIDSLRFLNDGTIVAERIVNTVLYRDNRKLGERAVSNREYIAHSYALCRKISFLKNADYEAPNTELVKLKKGFSLRFDAPLNAPSVFVVQDGQIFPGIWSWGPAGFAVLPSGQVLDETKPSCQVHTDPGGEIQDAITFRAMLPGGEVRGNKLFGSFSLPDGKTFMNCMPGGPVEKLLVKHFQEVWGRRLLGVSRR